MKQGLHQIEEWEVCGILARAFETRHPEAIARLHAQSLQPHLHNIRKVTNNDKYWRWASLVLNGQAPLPC